MGWLGTLLGPEGADAVWVCPSGLDRHLAERPRSGGTAEFISGSGALCRGTRRFGRRDRPYLENCIVDASICSCQVNKGTRRMPWHQEPKKDVGACDKPRGVGNQTSIRGFPNGET